MIYVFLGKDFNIVKLKIDELVNKLDISNIIKYDFSESNIGEILDEVNYIDLFNEKKLIIVSNFSFKKLKEKDEDRFSKYIDNMNDNVIIFRCIDDSLDERKKLTKLLRSKCKVEVVEKLDYKNLHEYVTKLLKDNNINATYNQVKRILDLCDYNVDYTISEVEKILIYKLNETELTDEDIEKVINRNTEKEIFDFIEYVYKKDLGHAMDSYKILVSGDSDEIILIDTLAKQFRLLYQVKLLKPTMSEQNLISTLKVNPYTLKKLYPYVNEYSEEDIIRILYKLSECDINIKVNGYDKSEVFESFLVTL